ncbi:YcfL family protein [Shewanella sp. JM162201]|uniref:YcfL family protein n=1 Tax=Shewanella jiangmenensis TaxID=2837387 RepID=A0ABS5UZ83_9GAMM|nr:YcfL family protein [Shewanella jiangmenensis]MBT1442943.1 YcfL family protein [Shewanella jiangmenensis]
MSTRIKGLLLVAMAATLALGTVGCANHTAGISASSSGETRVDNSNFGRDVSVSDLKLAVSGDMLKAHALIQSKSATDLRLQYRFSWYDANGLAIDSEGQSWQSLKLHGKQQQQVSSVAPNPNASSFEVYVRKAFSN